MRVIADPRRKRLGLRIDELRVVSVVVVGLAVLALVSSLRAVASLPMNFALTLFTPRSGNFVPANTAAPAFSCSSSGFQFARQRSTSSRE